MPIVNAFDFPQGGANGGFVPGEGGGGGGGGQSYSGITLEAQDLTDGSWTKLNPAAMTITGESHAAGVNTLTFGELATGASDYTTGGTVQAWPRFYKQLTTVDAAGNTVPLTTEDNVLLRVGMSGYDNVPFFLSRVVLITPDPTSTVTTDMDIAGVLVRTPTTAFGSHNVGALTVSSFNSSSVSKSTYPNSYMRGTIQTSGNTATPGTTTEDPKRPVLANVIAYQSTNETVPNASTSRNASGEYGAASPLYVVVAVATGSNSTTIVAGDTVDVSFSLRAISYA